MINRQLLALLFFKSELARVTRYFVGLSKFVDTWNADEALNRPLAVQKAGLSMAIGKQTPTTLNLRPGELFIVLEESHLPADIVLNLLAVKRMAEKISLRIGRVMLAGAVVGLD